ncbi:MAG: (p)ppGpp synthetase [Deltaproteobacteria bacterium]|nr:MAG: (p)ppGpp synthetase [Deltaproteobacteria bacterium]
MLPSIMMTESVSPPTAEASFAQLFETVSTQFSQDDLGVLRAGFDALSARCDESSPPIDLGHWIATARVLADMRIDPAAVTAALVAPLAVELDQSPAELTEALGAEVGSLLEGVKRLAAFRWDRIEEAAAESLRRMFVAMAQDIRVVLIVLAMRVQLLRVADRGGGEPEENQRLAAETLEVFAPLANRLGIWQLKWELEDRSFNQLEPETFAELTGLLADGREQRETFIKEVIDAIERELSEAGIEASVTGRPKHIYSIYKKMQRKQVSFDQIYDVSAVRVITERVPDCYAALGMVHSLWAPLPKEFDDYIARPKENRYQSLHTAVVGLRGRPVEVQIRTQEMHQYAEYGVAAHWAYKESRKASGTADEKFMVLRQLMDWERDVADPHQFVESLKTDIFKDQVYVFTPNGDIVDLPVGATPIDFAYRIHTMVGHRCRGARVNDQIQPLDYQLKTGDRVAILTHKSPRPSRDWMNSAFGYLRTASARTKVRQWYREQGRDKAIAEGRELCDKEIGRLELKHATIEEIAELIKYPSVEDMYKAVGYGDRSSQSVASAALQVERSKAPPEEAEIPPSVAPSTRKRSASGLALDGVDDILGKRARCCNPVPGDQVVGFVTRGRGIMIHRRDCCNVTATREPERLVAIDWGPGEGERHTVDVEIRAHDRPGLMRDLSEVVSNTGVNIRSARAEANKAGEAWLRLALELTSAEQVVKVLQRIDRFPGVLEVRRVGR